MLRNQARQCALKIPFRVARTTEKVPRFPGVSTAVSREQGSFSLLSRTSKVVLLLGIRGARINSVLRYGLLSDRHLPPSSGTLSPTPACISRAVQLCFALYAPLISSGTLCVRACFYAVPHLRLVEPRAGCTPAAIYFANCLLPVCLSKTQATP
jgi:hypothetical protein